jgi:hypothetical protein
MAKNIKNPGDMMSLTGGLTAPSLTIPKTLDAKQQADVLTYTIWLEEVSTYTKKLGIIKQNLKAVFRLNNGSAQRTKVIQMCNG